MSDMTDDGSLFPKRAAVGIAGTIASHHFWAEGAPIARPVGPLATVGIGPRHFQNRQSRNPSRLTPRR